MKGVRWLFGVGLIGMGIGPALLAAAPPPSPSAPASREKLDHFEARIRPLLISQCASCHTGSKAMGGLDVNSRAALLKGGKSGPALDLKSPEKSLLLQVVRYEGELKMPPAKKLAPAQLADFERWMREGAAWPVTAAAAPRTPESQWAFQPVRRPKVPVVRGAANPIDAFVRAQMKAPLRSPADRRTLIRRVTFDLTGLPPTPDEIDSFLADRRPDAWARVVDRLLASPHYGERWGRHWLDVVRYADTAGETADFPAEHAWRYRNYVIDSFNADKPYDQFIREQLAGDLLAKDGPPEKHSERVVATGYLAIARRFGFDSDADHYLTLDDAIDTLGKSFLGLSLACARCHDHKYDPISAADYYALYGILAGAKFANPGCEKNKSPRDMVAMNSPAEIERRLAPQRAALLQAEDALRRAEAAMAPAAAATKALAELPAAATLQGEIPNGGAQPFDSGELGWKVRTGDFIQLSILPKNGHGADSTQIELEIEADGGQRWSLTRDLIPAFDKLSERWQFFDLVPGPAPFTRFVRDAENTRGLLLWRGSIDWPSAFANPAETTLKFSTVTLPPKSIALHPGPQGGAAAAWVSPIDGVIRVRGKVADADATGGDGIAWKLEHRIGYAAALGKMFAATAVRDAALLHRNQLAAQAPPIDLAYAVAEGKPGDTRLQKRGNPEDLGEVVPRRFLQVLGGQKLPQTQESGRRQLAEWIASPANPLTARVIVNRVWQHHFGTGLVASPNDFGARGDRPTNPALLDFLASVFVTVPRPGSAAPDSGPGTSDSGLSLGWSIKKLHRLILLSQAYQQASGSPPTLRNSKSEIHSPHSTVPKARRLQAEEIRDAMLAVSGDLDPTPGGAHPFPPASQRGYTQHTPFNAVYDHNKRSVYLMVQRIRRHPFLALFDGADPNASTAVRGESTVPTQALYFMNSPFVHERAAHFAARLLKEAPTDDARIDRACRLLYGRPASAEDQKEAAAFLTAYRQRLKSGGAEPKAAAWAAYCRVLFASNEFLYVE